ncbi:MAG: hypothetical protein GXO75_19040 [Calditrichaeota bacterium]|nr:hypothetical protein [Calditrichota bacterium]
MKIIVKGDKAEFDVYDFIWELLDGTDEETVKNIADSLACHDKIIKYVADQIIDGWTELMSHGHKSIIAHPEPYNPLDKAVRRIAKSSSYIAKREIENLEQELISAKEKIQQLEEELDKYKYPDRFK